MRRDILRALCGLSFIGVSTMMGTLCQAQDYPAKAMTIVVPFAAGSGTDQMARAMGQA